MLTVACVLSYGPKDGPKCEYTPEHVERLMRQVEGKISEPYRFICLTDQEVPCESTALTTGLSGWWSKIELFRPGVFKKGPLNRVIYLDLDVNIVGSLDALVDHPFPFSAIKDYQYPMRINSSVMVWDAGVADHVFSDFVPSVRERYRGDQNWINNRMPAAARFPREWCVSYEATVKPLGRIPNGARVIVYHGKPKPWDLKVTQVSG